MSDRDAAADTGKQRAQAIRRLKEAVSLRGRARDEQAVAKDPAPAEAEETPAPQRSARKS